MGKKRSRGKTKSMGMKRPRGKTKHKVVDLGPKTIANLARAITNEMPTSIRAEVDDFAIQRAVQQAIVDAYDDLYGRDDAGDSGDDTGA